MLAEHVGVHAEQALLAYLPGNGNLKAGDGHYPGVKFHAPAVRLLDGELQGVVARVLVVDACQCHVPRLDLAGIDDGSPDARLQQHGVYAATLQLVQYLAELLLLLRASGLVGRLGLGPVQSVQCGEPYGSYFPLGGRLSRDEQFLSTDRRNGHEE